MRNAMVGKPGVAMVVDFQGRGPPSVPCGCTVRKLADAGVVCVTVTMPATATDPYERCWAVVAAAL